MGKGVWDNHQEEVCVSNCKGCGKGIIWGVTLEGKKIPLEECKHVYVGVNTNYPIGTNDFEITKPPVVIWISHFLTCPKANNFSGSQKTKGQREFEVATEILINNTKGIKPPQ
jgi:hypothetical protein